MRAPVALFLFLSLNVAAAEFPISEPARFAPAEASSTSRYAPSVASGEQGFLVAWEERIYAGYPGPISFRAYDANGEPRQPSQMSLAYYGFTPRAVWTGSEYLLVFGSGSRFGHGSVYTVRIAADGTVLSDPLRIITDTVTSTYMLDLVWDGLYAWALAQYDFQSHLIQLDANGRLGSSRTAGGATALAPSPGMSLPWMLDVKDGDLAASRPGEIATLDHTAIGEVVALRNEFGAIHDAFTIAPAGANIRSLAWDGSAWVAAYATEQSLCTLRFTSAADLMRDCIAGSVRDPWIAAGPRRTFIAWTEGVAEYGGAGHAEVVTSGGIASMAIASQRFPVATVDSTGLLVAWLESSAIYLGGFTNEGVRRPEIVLHTDAITDRLALAAAEDQSLLVFVEKGVVRATLLDAHGSPILTRIALGEGSAPRVVALGRDWLVAWQTNGEIVSTLVSRGGNPNGLQHYEAADPTFAISATSNGFLLARTEAHRLVVERLDANGASIETTDIATESHPTAPYMTCGPATCLVTWYEGGNMRRGLVIGHNATPRGGITSLGNLLVLNAVRAQSDGSFLLYEVRLVLSVSPSGALTGTSVWTSEPWLDLGAIVDFRARPAFVYSRFGRIYFNDFAQRARAVRH